MNIKPFNADNADFSLVELRDDGKVGRLTPHCKIHGAMNKISTEGMWRCVSMYAVIDMNYKLTPKQIAEGKQLPPKINERVCDSACWEE